MSKRNEAAWIDERNTDRGDMRVNQAFSKLRADDAYEQAQACAECQAERDTTGDEEALCEAHLAQAMGMNSEWP